MVKLLLALALLEALYIVVLRLASREQEQTIDRLRRFKTKCEKWNSSPPYFTDARELQSVLEVLAPNNGSFAFHHSTSADVAPGVTLVTLTTSAPSGGPNCTACGDLGKEGGCRVCGA